MFFGKINLKEIIKNKPIFSYISLCISAIGTLLYFIMIGGKLYFLKYFFIIFGLISVVLPPIAKKLRLKNNLYLYGKNIEIFAIVLGGINFYYIISIFTKMPILIACLGWVICALVYKFVK